MAEFPPGIGDELPECAETRLVRPNETEAVVGFWVTMVSSRVIRSFVRGRNDSPERAPTETPMNGLWDLGLVTVHSDKIPRLLAEVQQDKTGTVSGR